MKESEKESEIETKRGKVGRRKAEAENGTDENVILLQ
jgi:hypothetical protein